MRQGSFASGCLWAAGLLAAVGGPVWGEMVTIDFTETVVEVGAHGDTALTAGFMVGESVRVRFTYDDATPENASDVGDPNRGGYNDPAMTLSFEFLTSGRQFNLTGGTFGRVSVGDNLQASLNGQVVELVDNLQTFIGTGAGGGGTIDNTINGRTPDLVGVEFKDIEDVASGIIPDMVSNDSLPTSIGRPDFILLSFAFTISEDPFEQDVLGIFLIGLPSEVPDPASASLLAVGLVGLVRRRRR